MNVSTRTNSIRAAWGLALALCAAGLSGCGGPTIETTYGRRTGESVAGTGVLAEMFEQAGHRVTSWRVLSPRLENADTIVWAPDNFLPPKPETIAWLEDWRSLGGTLIYIGRDYSPAVDYWQAILPGAPPAQAKEIRAKLGSAKTDFNLARSEISTPHECSWFTADGSKKGGPVKTLAGPWSQGINAAKTDLELPRSFLPNEPDERLLTSGEQVLVSRNAPVYSGDGQLILVANGSFLLNVPLVNHEHRKLAGKLIAATGPPGEVVFLESDGDDPEIMDEDPATDMPTGMEVFFLWPLNFILLHLALLGIIFAFARAPIFGIPRLLPVPVLSDFARHVDALGELLQKTRNRTYAAAQLRHYHQLLRGERPSKDDAP